MEETGDSKGFQTFLCSPLDLVLLLVNNFHAD